MSKILTNLIYYWKKPKVIIVTGENNSLFAEAIFQILRQSFRVKKERQLLNWWNILKMREEILILEIDFKKIAVQDFQKMIKHSSLSVLIVARLGEIPSNGYPFIGEKEKAVEIIKLAKILPDFGYLILNFDDETVREIKEEVNLRVITFGFGEEADFKATNIKFNDGTNFKINYKGSVVPIWLAFMPESGQGAVKEQIYAILSAACIGTIFDLNLVEISQNLKKLFFSGRN